MKKLLVLFVLCVIAQIGFGKSCHLPSWEKRRELYHPDYSNLCYNIYHVRSNCVECSTWDNMTVEERQKVIDEKRSEQAKRECWLPFILAAPVIVLFMVFFFCVWKEEVK